MNFTTLVWKEIRERPTAMLTGLLTITLGVAALVAIRNVTFFSERAVARIAGYSQGYSAAVILLLRNPDSKCPGRPRVTMIRFFP